MEVHFLEFKRPKDFWKLFFHKDDSRDLDFTTQWSPTVREKDHDISSFGDLIILVKT